MENFSLSSFIARWLAAIALVFVTFNPTQWSYYHWVAENFPKIGPLETVVGLLLIAAWAFFLHSTMRSIGGLGLALGIAFCASLIWLFQSWGWLALDNTRAITWVVLLMLSLILAIGLSWSHLRRAIAGQADVDDVDQR